MNEQNDAASFLPAGAGRKLTVIGLEITVKLDSTTTGGGLYVFEADLEPGEGVPPHVHHREDEVLEVLGGELEVYLGGKVLRAAPGTVALFPRDVVHGFRNPGPDHARARFLVSPGKNFEDFFEELGALPADVPPDPAVLNEIFDRFGLPLVPEAEF